MVEDFVSVAWEWWTQEHHLRSDCKKRKPGYERKQRQGGWVWKTGNLDSVLWKRASEEADVEACLVRTKAEFYCQSFCPLFFLILFYLWPLFVESYFSVSYLYFSEEFLKTKKASKLKMRKRQPLQHKGERKILGWSSCASQITHNVGCQRFLRSFWHWYHSFGRQREIRRWCGKEVSRLTTLPPQYVKGLKGGNEERIRRVII